MIRTCRHGGGHSSARYSPDRRHRDYRRDFSPHRERERERYRERDRSPPRYRERSRSREREAEYRKYYEDRDRYRDRERDRDRWDARHYHSSVAHSFIFFLIDYSSGRGEKTGTEETRGLQRPGLRKSRGERRQETKRGDKLNGLTPKSIYNSWCVRTERVWMILNAMQFTYLKFQAVYNILPNWLLQQTVFDGFLTLHLS